MSQDKKAQVPFVCGRRGSTTPHPFHQTARHAALGVGRYGVKSRLYTFQTTRLEGSPGGGAITQGRKVGSSQSTYGGEMIAARLAFILCVVLKTGSASAVQHRARTAAPHCGSHCRPRTATPPLLIALSPRTACSTRRMLAAGLRQAGQDEARLRLPGLLP